jgi:translation initiation factor 2D
MTCKPIEELILPSVIKHTTFKSPKDNIDTLYTDSEQTPLWFSSHGQYIPTVYTTWKYPFLRVIQTNHHVIERIINGADLMLPGCIPPFEGIHKDDIVGIVDYRTPSKTIAVGRVLMDMHEISECVGTTGVAVKVIHRYDDVVCHVVKKRVDIPDKVKSVEEINMEYKVGTAEDQPQPEDQPEQHEQHERYEQHEEERKEDTKCNDLTDDMNSLTVEDNDHFFKRSLLQTLSQNPMFPLNSSNFMDHINSNLLIEQTIKKTSWKKSAKFLKAMEKDGLIKLKGKGDDLVIISYNKDHEQLKTFNPYKVKKQASRKEKKEETEKIVLTKFYKPTNPVRMVFNSLDLEYNSCYIASDLKEILNKYITKEELVNEQNKKNIIINDVLANLTKESTVGRDKLFPLFLAKFTQHYTISKGLRTSKLQKGNPPKVSIITETKIGRKTITRVFNFEPYEIDSEELSMDLKQKCSGSSTIHNNVQNPKIKEVLVQGSHASKIIELLVKKYGLNQGWIESEDKSKKKK